MNASKDENFTNSITAVLNTDGTTIIRVQIDPTTHRLKADDNTTGTDRGPVNVPRDGNNVPTLFAVSSSDGVTPVALYADSTGKLLTQST